MYFYFILCDIKKEMGKTGRRNQSRPGREEPQSPAGLCSACSPAAVRGGAQIRLSALRRSSPSKGAVRQRRLLAERFITPRTSNGPSASQRSPQPPQPVPTRTTGRAGTATHRVLGGRPTAAGLSGTGQRCRDGAAGGHCTAARRAPRPALPRDRPVTPRRSVPPRPGPAPWGRPGTGPAGLPSQDSLRIAPPTRSELTATDRSPPRPAATPPGSGSSTARSARSRGASQTPPTRGHGSCGAERPHEAAAVRVCSFLLRLGERSRLRDPIGARVPPALPADWAWFP